jgi:phosphoglycolate phosphatase-like HAD superfamily hydrolase
VTAPSLAFRHVVLDLDGTLVDTKDDLAAAVNVTLAALGLPGAGPADACSATSATGRACCSSARSARARTAHRGRPRRLHAVVPRALCWTTPPCIRVSARCSRRWREEGAVFSVLTNKPEDMSAKILAGLELETLCPR